MNTMEEPKQPEQEKTLKELQAELVELGMPKEDTEKLTTKAAVTATINVLKAVKAANTVDPVESPKEEKEVEKKWTTKRDIMRANLEAQPETQIMIPTEGKEKAGVVEWVFDKKTKRMEQVHISGAVQPVTLNGYRYLVPKGRMVKVPEQIAQVITESMEETRQAGQDLLIDRTDPETGRPVRDQL
jgi:hypothetical protein